MEQKGRRKARLDIIYQRYLLCVLLLMVSSTFATARDSAIQSSFLKLPSLAHIYDAGLPSASLGQERSLFWPIASFVVSCAIAVSIRSLLARRPSGSQKQPQGKAIVEQRRQRVRGMLRETSPKFGTIANI